jgi:UDP-N-acetylmuramoyl-L-alanyl-D-glutamate--2,6-diaminopimelate ligase
MKVDGSSIKLLELVGKLDYDLISGNTDLDISGLTADSRNAARGFAFVCIVGTASDGHSYIGDVVGRGVSLLVVQEGADYSEQLDGCDTNGVTVISVKDTRLALAYMSAAWFGYPDRKLKTIGVTGTKGKTTTTYMIKNVLEACGHKTGLIGTIEAIVGDEHIPAHNTTPESYDIHRLFRRMVDEGCEAVVMEVSSQGLMMNRTAGIQFDYGVFTNIEPDHIGPNEHSSFEDYLRCKALLFRQCDVGIVNGDDAHVGDITAEATCHIETFGLNKDNDIYADEVELLHDNGRIGCNYRVRGLVDDRVSLGMPGQFSIYNSLCAIAVTRHFGVDRELLKSALLNVRVRGRVELVDNDRGFTIMVDYAHNAMALESLLKTLREYNRPITTVFGCGGNRAKSRRFEMGEVSGRLSDYTIITSDNPRDEEPEAIIGDIITGISRTDGSYRAIADRSQAIRYAVDNAKPGDIVVVAGKGHEDYQEIHGVRHHMDDRELILAALGEGK